MLLIIKTTSPSGETFEHVVLTKQPRLSIPSFNFPEIPAGMLDGSGDFVVTLLSALCECVLWTCISSSPNS